MRGQIFRRRTRSGEPGAWWYRLRVPPRLRSELGWELRRSLGTEDLEEARRRAVDVARWAEQRLLKATLADLEHQRNVDQQLTDEQRQDAIEAALSPAWRRWDYALRHDGVLIGPEPPGGPAMAPAGGYAEVSQQVSLKGLVEAWAEERRPREKTVAEAHRAVARFTTFLGHEDAERVSRKDVIAWRGELTAKGLSAKTVTDLITTLKTIYNSAIASERLVRTDNPAAGVPVLAREEPGQGRRGFTPAEARNCLEAARRATESRRQGEREIGYLVYLMAATGARIGELAQLLVSDVRHSPEGGWHLSIEAGQGKRLKSGAAERLIPLPAQVVGDLLAYVEGLPKDGPLFPSIKPDLYGSKGGTATKKVTRLLRPLLPDPRVAPAHSWRHTYVTGSGRPGSAGKSQRRSWATRPGRCMIGTAPLATLCRCSGRRLTRWSRCREGGPLNDPHVVSLTYRVRHSDPVDFNRAPPVGVDRGSFGITG